MAKTRTNLSKVDWTAIALFGLIGLILRIVMMLSPAGDVDSDGAIIGIMAKNYHLRHFPVFYLGQNYGGSQEAIIAKVLFRLIPMNTITLMMIPEFFAVLSAFLLFKICQELYNERVGWLAAAFFWIFPPAFLWWATKMGTYWAALASMLAAVLWLIRSYKKPSWLNFSMLGFLGGLAFWGNPQTLEILLPAGIVWLIQFWRKDHSELLKLPSAVVGFGIGSIPWFYENLTHHWLSLQSPTPPDVKTSYFQHLIIISKIVLPMALGFRDTFTRAWINGLAFPAFIVLIGVIGLMAWKYLEIRLLLLITAAGVLIYAISPYAGFGDQPRYALFIFPVLIVVFAYLLDKTKFSWLGLIFAAAISLRGVIFFNSYYLDAVPTADDFARLQATLTQRAETSGYAEYWTAYLVDFKTGGRINLTPQIGSRDEVIANRVEAAPNPIYVFYAPSKLKIFLAAANSQGVKVKLRTAGHFVIAEPTSPLRPDLVAPAL